MAVSLVVVGHKSHCSCALAEGDPWKVAPQALGRWWATLWESWTSGIGHHTATLGPRRRAHEEAARTNRLSAALNSKFKAGNYTEIFGL